MFRSYNYFFDVVNDNILMTYILNFTFLCIYVLYNLYFTYIFINLPVDFSY